MFEAGYVAGFLGLLGLYPTVAERSPRLAGVGAITAFLGLVAFSVFTVTNLAELLGLASGDPPGWTAFTVMAASGFIVGYLAVGIVVLRSGVYSRTVGLLLVLPGVIIILMFATIALEIASPASVFVVSAGQAMTHLAIGSTLRAETESTGQEEAEQTPETTVRG